MGKGHEQLRRHQNKNSTGEKPRRQLFPSRWPQGYPKQNEQYEKDQQKADEHRQLK